MKINPETAKKLFDEMIDRINEKDEEYNSPTRRQCRKTLFDALRYVVEREEGKFANDCDVLSTIYDDDHILKVAYGGKITDTRRVQ